MAHRQLGAAIWQIWHSNLLASLLNDVVKTPPWYGRKILAIGIAWAILDRARNTHVTLGFGKPRRYLLIVNRPVFTDTVQAGRLEIDVAKTARRPAPEICFAASSLASLPVPIRPGSIAINNIMLPHTRPLIVFSLFD